MGDAADAALAGRHRTYQACRGAAAALAVTLWMTVLAAGTAPAWLLLGWAGVSVLVISAGLLTRSSRSGLPLGRSASGWRFQSLEAALAGLVAGAAATLFLAGLPWPERIALSLAACAGLVGALAFRELPGPAFRESAYRLQLAGCAGQFALAWWQLDEPGTVLAAWSIAGFAVMAAACSARHDDLSRRARAAAGENRRLVEALAGAGERERAARQTKSRFIAMASHDLRQPAAALALNADLLSGRIDDPELAPALDGLRHSVGALNALLDRLFELSQLDSGRVRIAAQPTPVDRLIDRLASAARPRAASRGLEIRTRHCGCVARFDPKLVSWMLNELIDNALNCTAHGRITVGARVAGQLELSVTDTGCGIAASHHERIFDDHYQVDNVSRQRERGLGLGLAIVKRIAALHEAAVTLRSRPGRGSRFTLRFHEAAVWPVAGRPACPACRDATPIETAAPAAPAVPIPPTGLPAARRQLLLVEDDTLLADAFLVWLSDSDLEVAHAADAKTALAMLARPAPLAFVISDFRLPGELDGLAVLARAGEQHPQAHRILVTGELDPGLAHRCTAIGATLLSKPVDPDRLRRLLREPGTGFRVG